MIFALLIFLIAGLAWVGYMESPERAREQAMNRCVKACVRRTPKISTTAWPKPSYRWYY